MDRVADERPPLSLLDGSQLRLGLMEEGKKETLFEDLWSFTGLFSTYLFRRVRGVLSVLFRAVFSGFALTEQLKTWLSRLFIRRKGQLAFPFAHATLVGVSLTLLLVTAGLGGIIFKKPKTLSSINPFILENKTELNTQESTLLRDETITYTVAEELNIYQIAENFHIPGDALIYANRLRYPYTLEAGQTLVVPAFQMSLYEVKSTVTVESVAKLFGAQPQDIIDFNYLFPDEDGVYRLREIGQKITVPTYQQGSTAWAPAPKGECSNPELIWPTTSRGITQRWKPWHTGIDIDTGVEPLFVAATGTVSAIAPEGGGVVPSYFWNHESGGMVMIDLDGTGFRLVYKHLSRIDVRTGQKVSQGKVLGLSGNTGRSTGTHLHFEVHCNGEATDPLYYLPGPVQSVSL
ncbi:MAG: peptidase M23 family protein [candidate division WWE3 bacterium CSP1-7]|uniref:LysM domain-containing protein n=2 Tax=Katanobacteria TaxID=422282 RepID=A0A1F4WHQ1_UNCKA|nr:MAG: peptidase M23 family protein [candidate division WWE3 bacterium CSP1-7]OGC68921.1 MAG: hypothetical protein A3J33_03615 [candidate division WWE3 bacterium RIFCSPLOWO2_02_FULL_53_10]